MSSSIKPVGSVSNSVMVDFKTFADLKANDTIIQQKIIKHLFDNGTNKASNVDSIVGYPENPIRIRAGSYAINNIPSGGTISGKVISFGEGLYPVQVYVSTSNISVYASSETLTSKSFNLKAYNFSGTASKNVVIYWWAICVDKTI